MNGTTTIVAAAFGGKASTCTEFNEESLVDVLPPCLDISYAGWPGIDTSTGFNGDKA